jgi:hypothetical protein
MVVQMYLIIFLTAGYVFDVNYDLKFKPSFMLKSAANESFFGLICKLLYKENLR